MVPGIQRQVAVLGFVTKPGYYVFGEGARVSDAIAMASGEAREEGDLTAVRLQRADGSMAIVNLKQSLKGGADPDNPLLKPGDTIVVAEAKNQVLVLGLVAKPGYYRLGENDRLMDMIAKAGGGVLGASLVRTYVVREEDGKQVALRVNVQDIMAGKNLAANIALKPNDIIVIPKSKALNFDDLLKALVGFYYVKQL